EHVGFVGFREEPAECYRALDVVVHASTRPEPFGLTIAEAMACGRAVIAAQAGGAAELFTPGYDALGVAPGDVAALAEAVVALGVDSRWRRALGAAARDTAERRFDARRWRTEVPDLYRNLLASRGEVQATTESGQDGVSALGALPGPAENTLPQ